MDGSGSWSCRDVFPAEPQSPSRARDFVCGQLAAHGLDSMVDDARLVVSELATNAMRHAGTPFAVTILFGSGSVVISVQDRSSVGPVVIPRQSSGEDLGGRGLMIVDQVSRDWGVSSEPAGTKSVWASFDA